MMLTEHQPVVPSGHIHTSSFAIGAGNDEPVSERNDLTMEDDFPSASKAKGSSMMKAIKSPMKYAGKQLANISTNTSGHRRTTQKTLNMLSDKSMLDTTDTTYSLDQ